MAGFAIVGDGAAVGGGMAAVVAAEAPWKIRVPEIVGISSPVRWASAPTVMAMATQALRTSVRSGSSEALGFERSGGMLGESASRGLHHAIRDAPGPRSHRAQSNGGKNVNVVALSDGDAAARILNRGERRTERATEPAGLSGRASGSGAATSGPVGTLVENSRRDGLDAALAGTFDQPQAMVVGGDDHLSRLRPMNKSISLRRFSLKHFNLARGIRCA